MSVEAMAAVLHHSRASGTRKLVLLGVANHEGDGGAWPSVATLAVYANVTERNVQKAIEWLVGKGELRVEVQGGGGRDTRDQFRPNRYHVLVQCPPSCDRSTRHLDNRKRGTRARQLELSTGVSHPTPHLGVRGVASDRGGVSHPTPEPSLEPPNPRPVVPQLQDTRPCSTCGQVQARCLAAQAHHPVDDRHTYNPAPVRHAQG